MGEDGALLGYKIDLRHRNLLPSGEFSRCRAALESRISLLYLSTVFRDSTAFSLAVKSRNDALEPRTNCRLNFVRGLGAGVAIMGVNLKRFLTLSVSFEIDIDGPTFGLGKNGLSGI
jgi:hypothetical protein